MIKVGIIGGHTSDAGELIRILVNHPEVDIWTIYSPAKTGHKISSVHTGLIGEADLMFTDKFDPTTLDAVFILDNSTLSKRIKENIEAFPELRIIDLSPERRPEETVQDYAYGLSEINRKALVRGARMAVVPSPIASVALIALNPLASHLLLSSNVNIHVSIPKSLNNSLSPDIVSQEIRRQLKKLQNSFDYAVDVDIRESSFTRGMKIKMDLKCQLTLEEVSKVYESVYDDHNFTFITRERIGEAEVEGTQKCVVSISKPDSETLRIEAVGDAHLRGGAGDAVHIMNLFFSLHEKIGLSLKPSFYDTKPDSQDLPQTSWFA